VGVGAVVFGNVPAHTTVIGNPARQFKFKPEG
jgi:acetyltransferase-like isoleucine patch superfamily enzyme